MIPVYRLVTRKGRVSLYFSEYASGGLFTSDGCTGIPGGLLKFQGCLAHDLIYHNGGDLSLKRESDRRLRRLFSFKSTLLGIGASILLPLFSGPHWGSRKIDRIKLNTLLMAEFDSDYEECILTDNIMCDIILRSAKAHDFEKYNLQTGSVIDYKSMHPVITEDKNVVLNTLLSYCRQFDGVGRLEAMA